jgi:hypothetical protein
MFSSIRDVRSGSNSGAKADIGLLTLCATSGNRPVQNTNAPNEAFSSFSEKDRQGAALSARRVAWGSIACPMKARCPWKGRMLQSLWLALSLLPPVLWPVQNMAQHLAEPFSIRCERDGYYFLSFDTNTRRVVYEAASRPGSEGRMYKGRILSVDGQDIRFDLIVGGLPRSEFVYRRKEAVIDLLHHDARTELVNCVPAALRRGLSIYDAIWPPD